MLKDESCSQDVTVMQSLTNPGKEHLRRAVLPRITALLCCTLSSQFCSTTASKHILSLTSNCEEKNWLPHQWTNNTSGNRYKRSNLNYIRSLYPKYEADFVYILNINTTIEFIYNNYLSKIVIEILFQYQIYNDLSRWVSLLSNYTE